MKVELSDLINVLKDYAGIGKENKPAEEKEEPKAEEPKAEEPKAEEPKAEEPKAEGENLSPELEKMKKDLERANVRADLAVAGFDAEMVEDFTPYLLGIEPEKRSEKIASMRQKYIKKQSATLHAPTGAGEPDLASEIANAMLAAMKE